MQDQHIIPQTYLKGFYNSNDKCLYSLDTSVYAFGKIASPSAKTTAQVCYKTDFYTLSNAFKLAFPKYKDFDRLYLEKKFQDYENDLSIIIKHFIDKQDFISAYEAGKLLYALFDFKVRNEYFRERIIGASYSNALSNILNEYLPVDEKLRTLDSQHFKKIEYAREQISLSLNSKEALAFQHIASLLRENSLHDQVISKLMFFKWLIFESDNEFFTSDNPGFCLDADNIVHNTKFHEDFFFIFPLTPSRCLVIKDQDLDLEYYNSLTIKKIYYGPSTSDATTRINNMILSNVNRYVFSCNKKKLKLFAQTIRYSANDGKTT